MLTPSELRERSVELRRQAEDWLGPVVKFDLPRGNAVEIRLRAKVSQKEFENLKKIFDLSELAFVESEDIVGDPSDD